VPLICKWSWQIAPGTINGSLIDFTDFLPTFAGVANISVPLYGILDGKEFLSSVKRQDRHSTQFYIYTF
jgi:arylsulfatase A-like enzyme